MEGNRYVRPLRCSKTEAGEGKTHICATTGWKIEECKCLYGEDAKRHVCGFLEMSHLNHSCFHLSVTGSNLRSDFTRDRLIEEGWKDCAPVLTCVRVRVKDRHARPCSQARASMTEGSKPRAPAGCVLAVTARASRKYLGIHIRAQRAP